MNVFQAIKQRHSVRSYTGASILDEDIEKMLKAARDAHSAKNIQPWKLIVITDRDRLKELVPTFKNQVFIENAGAVLVGITEDRKWAKIDLAIALDHLSLAAVELGLGTCWIGAYDEQELREKLNIPDEFDITICMSIGHPDGESSSPVKKSIDELVHWEDY